MASRVPRIESRVTAQERQMTMLQARIEELDEDITTQLTELSRDFQASFKQLADYQIAVEQKLDTIEAKMATKEDVAALVAASEARMLDAFQRLIAVIDTRLPPQH